jgi:hypothetical protein
MSVRKRTWESKDGSKTAWVVDYKDAGGNRCHKTFDKKKDADAWARRTHYEVDQGTHTPDSVSITVAEAAENWIQRAELEGLERSTIEQYRDHIEHHLVPLIRSFHLTNTLSN